MTQTKNTLIKMKNNLTSILKNVETAISLSNLITHWLIALSE